MLQLSHGKTETPVWQERAGLDEPLDQQVQPLKCDKEQQMQRQQGKTESPEELAETAELPGAELAADDKPGSLVVQMAGQHEAGKTGSPEEPAGAE